jgi:D-alanine-D-alanine ligase-like ATP-grasp enzyme
VEHEGSEPTRWRRHYPYVTRMAITLFERGDLPDVERLEVEPEFGYVTRLTYRGGGVRLTQGNDVGLNTASVTEALRDKEYTKFLLRSSGYHCPRGRTFVLPWWADAIGTSLANRGLADLSTTDDAPAYADQLGFPVYVKPVDGRKGSGVEQVHDAGDLRRVVDRLQAGRVKAMLMEETIAMPDHRVVVLRGEVISAYRRLPLAVVGNGRSSIGDLVEQLQVRFREEGRDTRLDPRDPRIASFLQRDGRSASTVPAADERVVLLPISNLSAGGSAEDVTTQVSQHWKALAIEATASLGAAFCGIDLACSDIEGGGDYSILEANAAPGLDHYAAVADEQQAVTRALYARVLNAAP